MMQSEDNTHKGAQVYQFPTQPAAHHPRRRERLKAAHRRVACRLGILLDPPQIGPDLLGSNARAKLRRNVSRLANLIGVEHDALSASETYTRAMFALYARQARGEDVSKALRAAMFIRQEVKCTLTAAPPKTKTQNSTESAPHGERLPADFETLLDGLPPNHHYQPIVVKDDSLQSLGIHEGDILLADFDVKPTDGAFSYVREVGGNFYLGYFFRESDGAVRIDHVDCEFCDPVILRSSELGGVAPVVHVLRQFAFGLRRPPISRNEEHGSVGSNAVSPTLGSHCSGLGLLQPYACRGGCSSVAAFLMASRAFSMASARSSDII